MLWVKICLGCGFYVDVTLYHLASTDADEVNSFNYIL